MVEFVEEGDIVIKEIKAYVDGSCLYGSPEFVGYATVIEKENVILKEISGKVPVTEVMSYNKQAWELKNTRNIAGEIFSVVATMKYCIENNVKKVIINHDCEGLEKWAVGEWKQNSDITAKYHSLMKECCKTIKITFNKIKAHKGKNKRPDFLAREAANNKEEDYSVWPNVTFDFNLPKRKELPEFIPDTNNENTMATKPATIKQLKFLKKLKCKEIPKNRYDASILIDKYMKLKEVKTI